jgi:hypothetical protein
MNKIIASLLFLNLSLSLVGMNGQDEPEQTDALLELASHPGSEKSLFARCVAGLKSSSGKKVAATCCILAGGLGLFAAGVGLGSLDHTAEMHARINDSSSDSGLPACTQWSANATLNPCTWIHSPFAWALVSCQSDQMVHESSDESCTPICWNTLHPYPVIAQSVPIGWNERESYEFYAHDCGPNSELENIDMLVRCPLRYWQKLKKQFDESNISYCEIDLTDPAYVGVMVKAYADQSENTFSGALQEAVNLQAYDNVVDATPSLMANGFCRSDADYARDLLNCEGELIEPSEPTSITKRTIGFMKKLFSFTRDRDE